MKNYKRVLTSAEVWAVIRARHPEMCVFSSYSEPSSENGGCMFTSYGFNQGDYPVIEAQTTWDTDQESPHKRINERHEYWLCIPLCEDL